MNKFDLMNGLHAVSALNGSDKKHTFKIVKILNYGEELYGIADIVSGDTAAMSRENAQLQIGKMIAADDWCQMRHSGGYKYLVIK